jgi:hypothetical protein
MEDWTVASIASTNCRIQSTQEPASRWLMSRVPAVRDPTELIDHLGPWRRPLHLSGYLGPEIGYAQHLGRPNDFFGLLKRVFPM